MTDLAPDAGVVLTGGASRRMGRDKALLRVDGVALAARAADTLTNAGCRPVWCQGGDAAALGQIGLTAFPDLEPGAGPVTGIISALRRADTPGVVVVACDLPDLTSSSIGRLREVAIGGDVDVVVATSGGRFHLVAWWSRSALDRLTARFVAGERSYRGAVAALRWTGVEIDEGDFRNVNHPDDVR